MRSTTTPLIGLRIVFRRMISICRWCSRSASLRLSRASRSSASASFFSVSGFVARLRRHELLLVQLLRARRPWSSCTPRATRPSARRLPSPRGAWRSRPRRARPPVSRMAISCPARTRSPRSTLTRSISPSIGARISSTWRGSMTQSNPAADACGGQREPQRSDPCRDADTPDVHEFPFIPRARERQRLIELPVEIERDAPRARIVRLRATLRERAAAPRQPSRGSGCRRCRRSAPPAARVPLAGVLAKYIILEADDRLEGTGIALPRRSGRRAAGRCAPTRGTRSGSRAGRRARRSRARAGCRCRGRPCWSRR